MDRERFDGLARALGRATGRRGLVRGLAGGAFGLLGAGIPGEAKRRRCRAARRCNGRCCPKGTRCTNGACVAACGDPFGCGLGGGGGGSCGGRDDCFCTTTAAGASACLGVPNITPCATFAACAADADCASGLVCAVCSCGGSADLRCMPPCQRKG